jgi:imidazolonepropionase-like amidohydrolase
MPQGNRSTRGARVRRLSALSLLVTTQALHSETVISQDLRIENVTIVSPENAREIDGAAVTIHDGRIQGISSTSLAAPAKERTAVQTLDGGNLYLIPGLIDSHVHLGGIPGMTAEQEKAHPDIARAARDQFPRSYLFSGFTTLIDLISTPDEMARWKSHAPVPDTYFCGGAGLIDGYPSNYLPKEIRYEAMPYLLVEAPPGSPLPPGVKAGEHTPQAVVTRMKADGAICVKTFFERGFGGVHNLPVPQADTIRALVRAAHAAGLTVLMHANSLEAQMFALDTGVDIIAHGLWNTDEKARPGELTALEKSVLDRIIAANVGWQPTLQVLYGLRNLFDDATLSDPRLTRVLPRSLIDWYRTPEGKWFRDSIVAESPELGAPPAAANILSGPINRVAAATGYMARHHARLLFGTDTPSAPTYANPPGLNGWMEMRHLADAGVTPEQIFQAATLSNARALKLDRDIGTVQVGKRANLLLVRADPRKTIQAYQQIVKVILGGRVLNPDALAADRLE